MMTVSTTKSVKLGKTKYIPRTRDQQKNWYPVYHISKHATAKLWLVLVYEQEKLLVNHNNNGLSLRELGLCLPAINYINNATIRIY